MKRFFKTIACICLLSAFALLLAGCIDIEMKVNNDGSCDLKYEIRTEGMVSLSDVREQLESSIEDMNSGAGKKVAKLKDIKEKDGRIIANISVSNVSYLAGDAWFGKYPDFVKEYPDYVERLYDAKSGEPVSADKIRGAGGLNVVKVDGMDTGGGDLSKFTLILPGEVKYMTSNVTMIDSKTVTVGGGYGVVLYSRGGGAGWLVCVLVIAAIAVVVIVLAGKKKKGAPSVSFTAAPGAAPVHSGAAAPNTANTAQEGAAAPTAAATTASAGGADIIYCPQCGSQLKRGARFCSKCGGKIPE